MDTNPQGGEVVDLVGKEEKSNNKDAEEEDVFFVYSDDDFPIEEQKRIKLDLQKFSHKRDDKNKHKQHKTKKHQLSENATTSPFVIDLTQKPNEKSSVWKEIKKVQGSSKPNIRTIIVPLHKAYNVPEKYMREIMGHSYKPQENKKGKAKNTGNQNRETGKQANRKRRKKVKVRKIASASKAGGKRGGEASRQVSGNMPPVQKKFRHPEPVRKVRGRTFKVKIPKSHK